MRHAERMLNLLKRKGLVRSSDLSDEGVPRVYLARLMAAGRIERVGRGLYRLPRTRPDDHHSRIAQVAKRVPGGIVCLLSSLWLRGFLKEPPGEVWLAIDRHAHAPKLDLGPVRFVRMSGSDWRRGVLTYGVRRVRVRATTTARTVVDCFRFQRLLPPGTAANALKMLRASKQWSLPTFMDFAKIFGVVDLLRPHFHPDELFAGLEGGKYYDIDLSQLGGAGCERPLRLDEIPDASWIDVYPDESDV